MHVTVGHDVARVGAISVAIPISISMWIWIAMCRLIHTFIIHTFTIHHLSFIIHHFTAIVGACTPYFRVYHDR